MVIIMSGVIILLGVLWLIYQFVKDASINDVTKDQDIDFRQAYIDVNTGKCSGKELNKRLNNGYYDRNKNKSK